MGMLGVRPMRPTGFGFATFAAGFLPAAGVLVLAVRP
jgi:hypothetical protein